MTWRCFFLQNATLSAKINEVKREEIFYSEILMLFFEIPTGF